MKHIHVIFVLFIANNFIFSMELERKNLASFFEITAFSEQKDILKEIFFCLSNKPWWYVDQRIAHKNAISQDKKLSVLVKYVNILASVCFNETGMHIIGFPYIDRERIYAHIWNRKDGTVLEKLNHNDFDTFYNKNEWIKKLYKSGNSPDNSPERRSYSDEMKLLRASFGPLSMMCWNNEEKIIVVPNFRFTGKVAYSWDCVGNKMLLDFKHQDQINSVDFNPQREEIITTSHDCTMRLWHVVTGEELLCIAYDTPVSSAGFNALGTEIVVATDDGMIRVLAQYDTYTISQVLLKKLLHLWLQVEKPSKQIDSVVKLLNTVASLLCCDELELCDAWASFPERMQTALWLSIHKKIQKYGK